MINASKVNLALKSEGYLCPYTTIFGYMYKYNDEIKNVGVKKAHLYGHAISVFEFRSKLWVYDVRYGTMLAGEAKDQYMYREKLKEWVSRTYNVTISDCFVVDDWDIPQSTIDSINGE